MSHPTRDEIVELICEYTATIACTPIPESDQDVADINAAFKQVTQALSALYAHLDRLQEEVESLKQLIPCKNPLCGHSVSQHSGHGHAIGSPEPHHCSACSCDWHSELPRPSLITRLGGGQ